MNPFPASVQLYSVRELAQADFPSVLRRIAGMGFTGVEFAGLHGHAAADVRRLLDDLGLVTSSAHGPLPTPENVDEIVEQARTLGYTRHVAGPHRDGVETREQVVAFAAAAQQAAELLAPHGMTFGLHNHWWEFDRVFGGLTPHRILMDRAPDVFAEVDTYWVRVAGADPAAVVRACGARAPLLHVKDGPGDRAKAMTAVGAGVMDWDAVFEAVHPDTEWIIVELDRCDGDMMQAVEDSLGYLAGRGFVRVRR